MARYTDDDIRSMKKVTAKIAADYLGISPMAVTIGMRNSLLPIGFAVHNQERDRGRFSESWSYTIACKQCGKLIKIIPKRKPRKFCSDTCRTAWWNSHPGCVDRKAVYEYICAHCGKPFTAYGNKERKYCSHGCYISDRFGEERDSRD